ncbi:MAG TPA: radical SAM protein [Tepidisphaeraceae bacterium]
MHSSDVQFVPLNVPAADFPTVSLDSLDNLWFQVTGTLCNLTCTHCFISCSPDNRAFGFLNFDAVIAALEESRPLGVKEYYFTGGEPFMHPRLLDMLEHTLAIGPATVLTNGTLLRDDAIRRLASLRDSSIYSLELRISIDAPDAAANDRIRGQGAFDKAMAGVRRLIAAGFLPIITMAQTWEDAEADAIYQRMRQVLLNMGYTRPRVKLLPSLKIGAEALRSRGYRDDERVTKAMMAGFDASILLCSNSRIITDRGVHVCPILIEQPDSVLGKTLQQAAACDFPLRHQACYTCWLHGAICSNASTSAGLKESPRAG